MEETEQLELMAVEQAILASEDDETVDDDSENDAVNLDEGGIADAILAAAALALVRTPGRAGRGGLKAIWKRRLWLC